MQVFRIFCELLAKMGPGSRINRGVPDGYRRNGESPKQGIDTQCAAASYWSFAAVEMEKARSRALTLISPPVVPSLPEGRNGESPKQGIDTGYYPCFRDFLVQ